MFAAATSWLEKNAPDIDSLNVFPVPDGDTGTNMLLTMRSSIEEAYRAPDHGAATVVRAMAKGALMGARGNSGVILSQILRGLAQGIAEKDIVTGKDLADALREASMAAYIGVTNPDLRHGSRRPRRRRFSRQNTEFAARAAAGGGG
jgi:dihydroxyacetone kinase-like predicted kinase